MALVTKQFKNMPMKERQEFRYRSFVEQSLKEDLREYENMGVVYKGGYDDNGRCILVALADRLMNDEVCTRSPWLSSNNIYRIYKNNKYIPNITPTEVCLPYFCRSCLSHALSSIFLIFFIFLPPKGGLLPPATV